MFKDMTLVWDLDNNQEVKDLIDISQFSLPETYVNLGVQINVPDSSEAKIKEE